MSTSFTDVHTKMVFKAFLGGMLGFMLFSSLVYASWFNTWLNASPQTFKDLRGKVILSANCHNEPYGNGTPDMQPGVVWLNQSATDKPISTKIEFKDARNRFWPTLFFD